MAPINLQISLSTDQTHSFGPVQPEYVSTTMDWWPPSDEAWGNSSIINANLSHPNLIAAAKGLSPFYLRIGGSQADEILYSFPFRNGTISTSLEEACKKRPQKCLTSQRWDDVLAFASNVGARIVFTLAYVRHTRDDRNVNDQKDWDSTNSRLFLEYTANSRYVSVVHGFELGNELRHKNKVKNVTRIVEAYKELRKMVISIWNMEERGTNSEPLLFGPASTGTHETSELIEQLGPYLDVITYHKYHGGGKDEYLPKYASSPSYYNHPFKFSDQPKAVVKFMSGNTRKAQLWIGEGAMAYNSGRRGVTDSFLGSLWFSNLLGVLTKTSPIPHNVYCRQALIGGHYELISHDNDNFVPNPDYWVAYAWKHIVGSSKAIGPIISPQRKDSLAFSSTYTFGCCKKPGSDTVLVHAFCANSNNGEIDNSPGDVVFIVINISKDKKVLLKVPQGTNRTEFVLTPNKQGLQWRDVLVNGELMSIDQSHNIPEMNGIYRESDETTSIPPISITFIVVRGAKVKECYSSKRFTAKGSKELHAVSNSTNTEKLSLKEETGDSFPEAVSDPISSKISGENRTTDNDTRNNSVSQSSLPTNPASNLTVMRLFTASHPPTQIDVSPRDDSILMEKSIVDDVSFATSKYNIAVQLNFVIVILCLAVCTRAWYKRRRIMLT
eukprot:CCRYP_000720-RA/>CCRYP_000720-RA protein AED:0.05 eAED:0.05 QI:161/1/1/1/0/0/2/172/666